MSCMPDQQIRNRPDFVATHESLDSPSRQYPLKRFVRSWMRSGSVLRARTLRWLRTPNQLRQLGDVDGNPPRLVATSSDGSPSADLAHPRNNTYASACPSCVVDAEAFGCFMNFPRRREARSHDSTLSTLPQVEPIFESFTQSHAALPTLSIKPCHRLRIILK
jgi:hypothetical protein